jgi:hypothetical protein
MSSGVVRIDAEDCDHAYSGTGFLLGGNLVATVAHVVEGDGTIAITSPSSHVTTAATVVGLSHDHDVALLRTDAALPGHRFTLAADYPEQDSDLTAIGFSLGGPMKPSHGIVQSLHEHVVVDGEGKPDYHLSDVVITDAALNPGNSGGPWIAPDGRVIALDEGGPGFTSNAAPVQGDNDGVSSVVARRDIAAWEASPESVPPGECFAPAASAQADLATLQRYFDDITASDYDSAFGQLESAKNGGYETFLDGVLTAEDSAGNGSGDLFIPGKTGVGADGLRYVDVDFQSKQDAAHAPKGTHDTCDLWTLRYKFVIVNGVPVIHSSPAQPGHEQFHAC